MVLINETVLPSETLFPLLMWRLIACFALAAGEFTTKQLDEMSSSLKTKTDEYQSQVVALGKELGNLSA